MIPTSRSLSHSFYQLAKQWKLGALLYRLYYMPRGVLQKWIDEGVFNTAIDNYERFQMEKAAHHLHPIPVNSGAEPFNIYFLSGKKYWYQTCFCAYSMAQNVNVVLRPIIYDDGSLEKAYQDAILKIFPNAVFVLQPEIEDQLDQYLPKAQFPYLRERRQTYPNLRKLTDVHVGSQGWKLVLDSDMLFLRAPQFILDWLQHPQQPCCMVDVETSYGYPLELMASLAGAPIPERLNVGICGLQSELIDWEKVEYWCKTLIEKQGTHYYQEQALIAMLMADQNPAIAPAEDYIVMPDQSEVMQPQAVLHHYVANSKSWYFRYGWKHCN